MPTGAELDAMHAERARQNGSAGAVDGVEVLDAPESGGDALLLPVLRIPEDELAAAIDDLPKREAQSLADAIFATPEPRAPATVRGVPVECTTLSPAQIEYLNTYCYKKDGHGKDAKLVPIMEKLRPAVLIFGLRVPGTDTPVFTMKQAKQVAKLHEGMGLMTTIFDLSGLTKTAQERIAGN
jgi:hypothetical protein